MARALELADLALGRTSPNPPVGAVVVKNGLIVGEGFTQPPGLPHAEVMALAMAGEQARGAELYVTLEPCCHDGRTPPCTDAISRAGIRAVHVATLDPYPLVNGQGIELLRRAGIEVTVGNHRSEAERLGAAFFHFVRSGRPFVTAKWAMTLDGKIATSSGDSRWITGEAARHLVHDERDASDAIVVGAGTIRSDDPLLTVRLAPSHGHRAPRARQPLRVVLDSLARTPPACRMLTEPGGGPVLVVTTSRAPMRDRERLQEAGAEVLVLDERDGLVDPAAVLAELARRGAIRVLLEGGSRVAGAFWSQRLVDRVLAFIAPKIVGGADAPGPVGARVADRLAEAVSLRALSVRQAGSDVVVEGVPVWPDQRDAL